MIKNFKNTDSRVINQAQGPSKQGLYVTDHPHTHEPGSDYRSFSVLSPQV